MNIVDLILEVLKVLLPGVEIGWLRRLSHLEITENVPSPIDFRCRYYDGFIRTSSPTNISWCGGSKIRNEGKKVFGIKFFSAILIIIICINKYFC